MRDKLGPARAELASEARSVMHEIGEIRRTLAPLPQPVFASYFSPTEVPQ